MRTTLSLTFALLTAAACSDAGTGMDAPLDAASGAADSSRPDAAPAADAGPAEQAESTPVPLPDGAPGIGFDDLQWSAALDRVIVPAGRAGYVGLLDPRSNRVTRLGELSATDAYAGGHGFGATSAIEAEGLVYAIDRTAMELVQLDPSTGDAHAAVALGASPDYVRFVPATRELWVTEPTAQRFEIFALDDGTPPALTLAGELGVSGGPESMVVAPDGTTAYTNTFAGETLRIDTVARSEDARFDNGCVISLGLAIDETGERLFVACGEGEAKSLDAVEGSVLSTLVASGGLDVIAYSSALQHLYLNGSDVGVLTVAGVADDGTLTELATVATAPSSGSSCVASDAYADIWVCDANAGQLSKIVDDY